MEKEEGLGMGDLQDLEFFVRKMLAYEDLDEAQVYLQGGTRCVVSDVPHWNEKMTAYVQSHWKNCHVAVTQSSSSLSGFQVSITPYRGPKWMSGEFVTFVGVAVVVGIATTLLMQ